MGRHRSRSRSRSYSPPVQRKRYDDPRDRNNNRSSYRDRRSPSPSGLLVRNISLDARPEDLRIPFERFGPLKDVYLPKNYYTGEPRGFGFVKFRYAEDAAEAKKQLHRTVIGGREIRIVFAEENRKTPQEMRRVTHTSDHGSYRRRSTSRSPRRQYQSYSRSAAPQRRDSRDQRARSDYYSPRRSRSISRSVSPRNERDYRSNHSSRRSRSVSRSPSPHDERNHKSSSQKEIGGSPYDEKYARSRSQSPRRKTRSPSRSMSRSVSRSPSPR